MGAPRTLGVLLCLLAQLSPHPLGVTARSLPVPATVPTTVPVPITIPNTVPATVPTTTPVIVPGTVPNIVPDTVPTTAPTTIPVPTVAEEEEDDEEEKKTETEGRVMAALKHLASVLQNPPPGHRDPPSPETLLDLVPELRDLLVTSLSPPIAQPPNLPP